MDAITALAIGLGLGSLFVAVPALAFLTWSAVTSLPRDQGFARPQRSPSRPPWMDDKTKEGKS